MHFNLPFFVIVFWALVWGLEYIDASLRLALKGIKDCSLAISIIHMRTIRSMNNIWSHKTRKNVPTSKLFSKKLKVLTFDLPTILKMKYV